MIHRSPPSLKMRAIGLLAQREHSAQELRGKLLRLVHADALKRRSALEGGADPAIAAPETDEPSAAERLLTEVDELLVWLEGQGYLSESRFVEARVHARAPRFGRRRIEQELAQHGLGLDEAQAASLKDSERTRCREVWRRKFGTPPQSPQELARQTRFLLGRGFAPELVRKLLRDPSD